MKDKLFFFGTFNPQFQRRQFIAPEPSTLANGTTVVFPYRALGPVTQKRKVYSYAGKLTMQASSNHRFDLSLFGDPSTGEAGLQRFSTLRRVSYAGVPGTHDIEGGFSEIKYGSNNQTLRYDGIISRSWLIEGSVGHSTNKFDEIPTVGDQPLFTDVRSVPQRRHRRPGLLREQQRPQLPGDLEVHEHLHRRRQPPAPLWRRDGGHLLHP
jgi:hypothetical protein